MAATYLKGGHVADRIVEDDRPQGGVHVTVDRRVSARLVHDGNRDIVNIAQLLEELLRNETEMKVFGLR